MTTNDTATTDTAKEQDPSLLPIEQVSMPEDDVSDLRDVVDAINKLCETMKTSYDEYEDCEDVEELENVIPNENVPRKVHTYVAEKWCDTESGVASPEPAVAKPVPQIVENQSYTVVEPVVSMAPEVMVADIPLKFETCKTDRLSNTVDKPVILALDPTVSVSQNVEEYSWSEMVIEPVTEPIFEKVRIHKTEKSSDTIELQKAMVPTDIEVGRNIIAERFEEIEQIPSDVETVQCEPMSEMYYTASSEVSLLSDVDFHDKAQTEDSDKEKDDRNSVMTGHVAAMRERFESMTRTNTPCPDLIRSTSPSFEVFRNVSISPDKLE